MSQNNQEQKTLADGVPIVAGEFHRLRFWFIKTFIIFFGVVFGGIAIYTIFPEMYQIVSVAIILFTAGFVLWVMWISGILGPVEVDKK